MGQVYCITNIVNNKKYIGITKHTFRIRYNHRDDWWNSPNLTSVPLKKAISKYGRKKFKVEILEETEHLDSLNFLEKYYIKKLTTISPFGYNLTSGGDVDFITHPDSILKNRLSKLGKPGVGRNKKGHSKPQEQIQKAKATKKIKFQNGEIKIWNKNKKTGPMSPEAIKKSALAHKKPVAAYDINGNVIKQYAGVIDTKIDGFTPSCVSLCCKGKISTHRGLIWKYKDN